MRAPIALFTVALLVASTQPGLAEDAAPKGDAKTEKAQKAGKAKADKKELPDIVKKLIVAINIEPDEGPAPHKAKFSADLYDDDVTNPKFIWSFGDGGTSKEKAPTHTYKKPGDYTVTLRVEDTSKDWGDRVGTDESVVFVNPPGE